MAEPRPIADFLERDLTALLGRGELEPAFEVDPAIDSIRQVLRGAAAAPAEYRRFPMLVGDAGVGKSAIVRELARRAPPELGGRRLVTMDLAAVAAKHLDYAKARLEVEQALTVLKAEAAQTLAVLRGLTTMATYNLAARFLSALDDPRFLVLSEVRTSEHRWLVENRPELATRFLPVMVDEPEPARLERILRQPGVRVRDGIDVRDPKHAGIADGIEIRDLKHGAGIVVPRVTARCSVEVASRGARLELRGRDRTVLAALAPCLAAAPAPDLEVARTYGEGGTGARDPRTGAVMGRARDAFAGDLGRFLAAWRSGTRTGSPTS